MTDTRIATLLLGLSSALTGCYEGLGSPETLEVREAEPQAFEDVTRCAECHPNHVEEWEISNHAYAMQDPVFHAMVRVGQQATEGALGQFCVQCHSPIGMATGQTEVYRDPSTGAFAQDTEAVESLAASGVSCDVCHSITEVMEPVNARAILTPDGNRRGTIEDPVENRAHESSFSPLHAESDLCGMCHAVVNPKGALIEETFGEWEASSAAADDRQCQDCHMPSYTGQAATDGPERTVHRHTFVGVDVSLLPPEAFPGYDEMRAMTAALLQESVTMTVEPADGGLAVALENLAGHAVPSGATAERQMWLEVIVRDAAGTTVFESGTLDDNEDIRDGVEGHSLDPGTDPQLVYFGQQLVDAPGLAGLEEGPERDRLIAEADAACLPMGQGAVIADSGVEPVTFPWQASWQCNYMIPPDGVARHRYDLSSLRPGSYDVSIRLLFRTFPPYFLRALEESGGLDPAVKDRVPTVVMEETALTLTL